MEPITTEITRAIAETGLYTLIGLITIGGIANMKVFLNKFLAVFNLELVNRQKFNHLKRVINRNPEIIRQVKATYKEA